MADVVTFAGTRFVEQNRLYSQADPPLLSQSPRPGWASERKPGNTTPLKLAPNSRAGLLGRLVMRTLRAGPNLR